jgi:hypothetical protein
VGEFTMDYAEPPHEREPVTTIAWRLAHVIVGFASACGHRPDESHGHGEAHRTPFVIREAEGFRMGAKRFGCRDVWEVAHCRSS